MLVQNYYNKKYMDLDFEYTAMCEHYKFIEVMSELKSLNPCMDCVLDIGCSNGHFLWKYVDAKYKYGVDISSQAINDCEKYGVIGKVADLDNDDLFPTQMDVIFCMDVLEHLFNPVKVLENVCKCLNVGGFVVITVPNSFNISNRFNSNTFLDYNNEHIRHFNMYTLRKILLESGFEVVKIRGYGRIPLNRLFPSLLSYGFIAIGVKCE